MRKNPHVRICGGLGSATTLVYPTKPTRGVPTKRLPTGGYVERQNLNLRMGVRCFTRLTNAFAKRLQNHVHPLAILWPVMSMATRSGTPARVRLRANRPGFVGGPCSLRRKDSGARAWSTLPTPSQSVWESPPGGDTGSGHRAGPPEGRTAPPRGSRRPPRGWPGIVAPSSNVRNRPVVPRRRRSTTQPMTQPVTKNRPSPIHISGFTNCSQAVVSPKR